jgi:hypothetical protein
VLAATILEFYMAHQHLRRRIFIDRPLQIAVLLRTLMYWGVCLMAQLLMVFFVAAVTSTQDDFIAHGPQLWWHLQLTAAASLVLLPIILFDVLKLSHRWAGPILRLRNSLKSLGRGEAIPPVKFRQKDFWQDLAGDLNVVAAELDRRRGSSAQEPIVTASQNTLQTMSVPDSKPASSAV